MNEISYSLCACSSVFSFTHFYNFILGALERHLLTIIVKMQAGTTVYRHIQERGYMFLALCNTLVAHFTSSMIVAQRFLRFVTPPLNERTSERTDGRTDD